MRPTVLAGLFTASLLIAAPALAQMPPDPNIALNAQREAMKKLAALDGIWRGKASMTLPNGVRHEHTHTERVGTMLDGTIRVIEGKSYPDDGKPGFNAFAVMSFRPADGTYAMQSYAQGNAGNFPVTPTADGFRWEIAAGPATIRYTATVKDGSWTEIGERIMPGRDPVRFFEMKLQRVGDTDWPAAGAVPAK